MANTSSLLYKLFARFWEHVVAALGTKANAEDCNNLGIKVENITKDLETKADVGDCEDIKEKIESYENNITFEITYDNGDTKTIKVLGVDISE